MIEKIFILILSHMIGDYILQNNYLAQYKAKDHYVMFVHCFTYLLPLYIFFGFTWILLVVFITHFILDTLKARYNVTSIITDQLLHYLVLTLYLF